MRRRETLYLIILITIGLILEHFYEKPMNDIQINICSQNHLEYSLIYKFFLLKTYLHLDFLFLRQGVLLETSVGSTYVLILNKPDHFFRQRYPLRVPLKFFIHFHPRY